VAGQLLGQVVQIHVGIGNGQRIGL
jgi:hypothetical protein